MSFSYFVILVLNGLTLAGLFFVVAGGLTLVYGLMRMINLAHGALYVLSAALGFEVYKLLDNNWIMGLLAAGLAMMVIYIALYYVLFRHCLNDMIRPLMISLGVSWIATIFIRDMTMGEANVFNPDGFFRFSFPIGSMTYPVTRLFVLAVAILECVILGLVIKKTRIGQIIRAGVDDRDMVSALGINIKRVFLGVFALSGFLVGIGGVFGGTMFGFDHLMAPTMLMYSLLVIIVGGLGNIFGTAVASLIIGLLYSFLTAYVVNIAMVLIFIMVMVIMITKPHGLFGKEVRRS